MCIFDVVELVRSSAPIASPRTGGGRVYYEQRPRNQSSAFVGLDFGTAGDRVTVEFIALTGSGNEVIEMSQTKTVGCGVAGAVLSLLICSTMGAAKEEKVTLLRVPDKGIQPQVAAHGDSIHMIYFRGDDGAGDIFYVRSDDGGKSFSRPLRVNSQAGSAVATGNIRGAHLAVGKKGRIHVAWMGSGKAEPKALDKATPMLFARLNDEHTAFEPQRNVIESAAGLDGGGSVCADDAGNVCVAWHAPDLGLTGEGNRRVWVARSTDEGKTFAREKGASTEPAGVCGCCGMRALSDQKGTVYMLYRSAGQGANRDTYLLTSKDRGESFRSDRLDKWKVGICPMSSVALAQGSAAILAAWETDGQVYFVTIDPATGKRSDPVAAPGGGKGRKHPVVASNDKGETILVWTEGMGSNRGGSVAWQVFDKDGKPTADKGRTDGVPTWSLVAVFARPDGGFTVVY